MSVQDWTNRMSAPRSWNRSATHDLWLEAMWPEGPQGAEALYDSQSNPHVLQEIAIGSPNAYFGSPGRSAYPGGFRYHYCSRGMGSNKVPAVKETRRPGCGDWRLPRDAGSARLETLCNELAALRTTTGSANFINRIASGSQEATRNRPRSRGRSGALRASRATASPCASRLKAPWRRRWPPVTPCCAPRSAMRNSSLKQLRLPLPQRRRRSRFDGLTAA